MGDGFSKAGLIQQLDSSSGSGFSYADAVFAVNHITVNWFQQVRRPLGRPGVLLT